jgi:hypothetical protein
MALLGNREWDDVYLAARPKREYLFDSYDRKPHLSPYSAVPSALGLGRPRFSFLDGPIGGKIGKIDKQRKYGTLATKPVWRPGMELFGKFL